jgi:spermidine synthase
MIVSVLALCGIALMNALDAMPGAFVWKSLAVVLPTTFVLGFSFPASSALIGGTSTNVGARSGSLLATNTLGAILGTFAVPFFLIPLIGSPWAIAFTAAVNAATGIAIVMRSGESRTARGVVVVGAAALITTAGALIATHSIADPQIVRMQRRHETLYRSGEDEIASVQAGDADKSKQLWVNGYSMTFLTVDAKLMPVLPLMLRPESKTVLTIAFGMGSSFRSALIAGLKSDAVELVPSVPRMFDVFYSDAARFANDSIGRILIGDGRNYVELAGKQYDIIVVDPPPPLESSGVSIISSREFYAASAGRLTANGVMMQWIPWGQSLRNFKTHVRSFRSVFPNVIVAIGPAGAGFYMLGSFRPIAFNRNAINSVLSRRGVIDDISSAPDSPHLSTSQWEDAILRLVRLSGNEVSRFAGTGPVITDDRPLPEYFLIGSMTSPDESWLKLSDVRPTLK